MKVVFQKRELTLVVTDHARQRIVSRAINLKTLLDVIEDGTEVARSESNKYWVYKSISGRIDNMICLSLAIESPSLVVVTALVNWRPHR